MQLFAWGGRDLLKWWLRDWTFFLCHLVSRAIWAAGGQRGEVSIDHLNTMLQSVLPLDDKYASGYLVAFPGGQSYRPQANCPSQLTPSGPEKPPIS